MNNFWTNRKVLVTGADGFIGSHLVEYLLELGAQVRALSYYNSFNNWGWLEDISSTQLEIISGDIRDNGFCRTITKDIDTVFHLAALIAIPYSYVAPDSYVSTNIQGTLNMLQASQNSKCRRFIHTSTSEVYGTAQYVPIDETHPLQAQSPYSATKIGADALVNSFINSFDFPATIARPFNTYGPRQSARAIIPTIITQIAAGAQEIQLGDLTPTRDFNFVKDTCRGFVALAESEQTLGKTINICSNFEISMEDTLEIIKSTMKSEVQFIIDPKRIRPPGSEVFRLWGENSLIRELTTWEPEETIETGLSKTIKWFSNPAILEKYKAGIYNV